MKILAALLLLVARCCFVRPMRLPTVVIIGLGCSLYLNLLINVGLSNGHEAALVFMMDETKGTGLKR